MNMRNRRLIILTLSVLLLSMTTPSFAQRAKRGSSALSGFGTVGQTGVASGMNLGGTTGAFGTQGGIAQGNFMGTGAPMNMRTAMRSPSGHRLGQLRLPSAAVGAHSAFITPLNISLARSNGRATRDYTGRETWANVKTFGYGYQPGQQYMGVQHSNVLLSNWAFSAPIRNNRQGGKMSDNLSRLTIQNTPYLTADDIPPPDGKPARTVIDIMNDHVLSQQNLNQRRAWTAFSNGDYYRSRNLFLTSSSTLRPSPTTLIGMFFSDAANHRFNTAFYDLDRLLQINTGPASPIEEELFNPFSLNVSLSQHYYQEPDNEKDIPRHIERVWSENHMVNLISVFNNMGLNNPKLEDKCLAAQAILQWYSGIPATQEEAKSTLVRLKRDFPTSPYANLLDKLDESIAETEEE